MPITPSITKKHGTAVTPVLLHVHARGTTITGETYPEHKANYEWNFGDVDSDESVVNPVTGLMENTNRQHGVQAGHVYKEPGTYTISLTVRYYDHDSSTWISNTVTDSIIVLSAESQHWEVAYFDANATASLGLGTINEPYTTVAQMRTWLTASENRVAMLAGGSVFEAPDTDEVLSLIRSNQRIMKYVASDGTSNPVLKLGSTATATPVCSLVSEDGVVGQSEVVVITVTGTPSGGTFTIVHEGDETAAIAYNAASGTVQSQLESLTGIGAGNVAVSGSAGGPWTATFQSALANTHVSPLTIEQNGLTGGTSPSVTFTVSTQGIPPRSSVSNVLFQGVDFDGADNSNNGVHLSVDATDPGFFENVSLVDCKFSGCSGPLFEIDPDLNDSGTDAGQGIGLVRCSFNRHTSTTTAILVSVEDLFLAYGCSVYGGGAGDAFIAVRDFGAVFVQSNYAIRNCGMSQSTGIRFAVLVVGGVDGVLVQGNWITGARNGIALMKDDLTQANALDVIIDSNDLSNLGVTGLSEGRGVIVGEAERVTVRNNLFYENGYSSTAETLGMDIHVLDVADVDATSDPLWIEHNSAYRSYLKAASPFMEIDMLRHIEVHNNAVQSMGGVGNGSDTRRSLVRFTSAAYAEPPRNEKQVIDITATGGTFTLTFDSGGGPQTTGAIAYNATTAAVLAALEALSSIDVGEIEVTGDDGGPWLVEFVGGDLGPNFNVDAISIDTASLTGGSGTVDVLVEGHSGLSFFDGNRWYGPNMIRNAVAKPFAISGTFLPFSAEEGLQSWNNANDVNHDTVWDENGSSGNPGFVNPASGNFQFSPTDPLHDACAATHRGVWFDYRGNVRDAIPDCGAYEISDAAVSVNYVYLPTAKPSLPTAEGDSSQSGGIRYIEPGEPLLAHPNAMMDVDNRPHRQLAHRDNVVGGAVDAVLEDINNAFCRPPQDGSTFLGPHRSIFSFITVGHNPDGTIKLDGLDLSVLGFLRVDGGNQMLANLNMGSGENRVVNMANGVQANDAAAIQQVVLRTGGSMTGTLQMTNGATIAMGNENVTDLAPGAVGTDAVNLDQLQAAVAALQAAIAALKNNHIHKNLAGVSVTNQLLVNGVYLVMVHGTLPDGLSNSASLQIRLLSDSVQQAITEITNYPDGTGAWSMTFIRTVTGSNLNVSVQWQLAPFIPTSWAAAGLMRGITAVRLIGY